MNFKELLEIAKEGLNGIATAVTPDIRLEQAEFKTDENVWEIVVSYLVDNTNKRIHAVSKLSSSYEYYRIYKKIRIDGNKKIIGFYMFDK